MTLRRMPTWCTITPMGRQPAIVFFCHGSRDAGWRVPFDRIVDECRARAPGRRCELAFLELMAPSLPETIDQLAADGVTAIRIVPLFLAPGAHTRGDLPALIAQARQRWPQLTVTADATLTELPEVRAAIVGLALGNGKRLPDPAVRPRDEPPPVAGNAPRGGHQRFRT